MEMKVALLINTMNVVIWILLTSKKEMYLILGYSSNLLDATFTCPEIL